MEKTLFLMNKDHKVLQMVYDDEIHAVLKISDIHELKYAPPAVLDSKGMPNRRTLNEWWQGRAIPMSRNCLDRDFPYMEDPRVLAEQSKGLSLSDRYWVTESPETQKWADVNFFDNEFTDDLGLITLGEKQQSSDRSENLYSPNATLGGDLRKKWTIQEGKRVLLKSGSGLFRQEPYNEVITTALHRRLLNDTDFVLYSLQGRYSACPNMLGPDEELIPMWDVLKNSKKPNSMNDYDFCLDICQKLGIAKDVVSEHFEKMFMCDRILANSDRHYRNFGVIRNVETLEYTRMAPIYDSGASLWYDREVLRHMSDYEYRAKPFNLNGMEPVKQLKLFHNFDWFDEAKMKGFVDEADDILSKNSLISDERRDSILKGLQYNIDETTDYIRGEVLISASVPSAGRIIYQNRKGEWHMAFAIAIDGPAAAGKTTTAKKLAEKLDFTYIDTGAMYRAVALYLIRRGINPYDKEKVEAACGDIDISIAHADGVQAVYLNSEDVSAFIRTEEAGNAASACSANPTVRAKLVELQKRIATDTDVVMEGRDICTIVLPDAQVKIYLTADVHRRAQRRFRDLQMKGMNCCLAEVEDSLKERDHWDATRTISRLRIADGAVVVDSTDKTLDQVVDQILALVEKAGE